MKQITLSYCVWETKTFQVPDKWQKYFNVWQKDEEDLTNKEWKLLESTNLSHFIADMTGNNVNNIDDVECENYK